MSATIEVPKGLDKLSPEDQRLMDSMRADEAASPEPEPTPRAAPTPKIEPEATPEPEIEIDDPTAAEPGQSKTVPHQAFHAERERRKAAEERARQVEIDRASEMGRLQERLNTLAGIAQVATQPPPQAAPVAEELPDVNTDPVGHFQAVAAQLQRQVQEQAAILQGFTQRSQQSSQVADLQNWGRAQENAFAALNTDYDDAIKHLSKVRQQELAAIGVIDPGEQQRIMGQDAYNIAARTRQEGGNFAERLYKLAVQRGWQKPGAIPPLDADPADPVERQVAARNNATSISSVNGAGPGARLSVEKIANMSEKQFDALYSKLKDDPNALRDLMGH